MSEQEPPLKTCKSCGLVKRYQEFPPNKEMRSGRHSYCHKCNNELVKAGVIRKTGQPCNKCGSHRRLYYSKYCRECFNEYWRNWYEKRKQK